MTDQDRAYAQRIARMRQHNFLPAAAPPPAIYQRAIPPAAVASERLTLAVKHRKVGKAGSVTIGSGLSPGIRVAVLELDRQTYVVSSRSEADLRKIVASVPRAVSSPFAILSESLRGRKHDLSGARPRGSYTGPVEMPIVSDEDVLRDANVQRTRRVR